MEKEEKQHRKYQNLRYAYPVLCICSVIALFLTQYLGLYRNITLPVSSLTNRTGIYISSLIAAAVVFLLLRLIFMFIPLTFTDKFLNHSLSGKSSAILTAVLLVTTGLLMVHRRFFAEFTEYPQRDIPLKAFHLVQPPAAVLMLLFVSALLFAVFRSAQNKQLSTLLTWTAYLFTLCFVFYSLYVRSIDKGSGFDVHHGSAYLQSIYNTLYLVPFELVTSGNYGHYGIFYALPMRLFKLPSEAVFVLIGIAGVITTACSVYIIHTLVKHPGLRVVSAIALAVPQALVCLPNYWMNYPHRALFPMALMAWIVFTFRKSGQTRSDLKHKWLPAICLIISYLISMLAIVWNTETGLYCVLCAAAAYIIRDWQKYKWYSPRMLLRCLIHIAACIFSLAGAVGFVYLYNLLCCRKRGVPVIFSVKDFFYPYFTIETFIGRGFQAVPLFGNHAWIFVLLLFMGTLFFVIKRTTFFSEPAKNYAADLPAAGALAFLGFMQFTLYFEHASYDKLSMCHIPALILIAYFSENLHLPPFSFPPRSGKTIKELLVQSFAAICCLTLVVLSAEVLTMGPIELGLHMYQSHGKSDIHHLASLYNEVVPPDTFSIGSCVDILNYKLHQEPGGHYRDISDMFNGGSEVPERIVADALEKDQFVVWNMENREAVLINRILKADPAYTIIREIELGGYPLQLYAR